MIKNNFRKILIFFSIVILTGCSNEIPNEPPAAGSFNFFPGGLGTNYLYTITETDTGGTVLQSGFRYVLYSDSIFLGSRKYTVQLDSIATDSLNSNTTSYFRKTSTGVFYFVDTTQIINIIPDTLQADVTLLDESRLLLFPLQEGSLWTFYRMTVNLPSGVPVRVLNVEGKYLLAENVVLNLNSGTVNIVGIKIQYDMELISDITQPVQRFTAFVWVADNIGIIKLEGNSVLLGALLNGEFNFSDSTKTIMQELKEFEIN